MAQLLRNGACAQYGGVERLSFFHLVVERNMAEQQDQERLIIPELEPFIIPDKDVVPTSRELGRGAYGSVEEVEIPGALCAAKKIHDQLIQLGSEQQVS